MAKLLELIDFHYYYGNIHSVKGINLSVDEGEIVTLIGANGAGKTTTMQSISGLTARRGVVGKILFQGKEIQKYNGYKVATLGIAQSLEGRHVFSQLTVEENLMMGAYLRKDSKHIKDDLKCVRPLPASAGAAHPDGGYPLRRRAADAGHGPRADEQTQAAAAG